VKIVSVVGARPELVQVAPLSRALRRDHTEILVHTGQHYGAAMSDVFFDELKIPPPDHHLGVGSGTHGEQTAAIMREFEPVLAREKPDLVIVRGDTNSTLACALVAAKANVPLAHVEAGERSFRRSMPEEVNRIVVDHVSSLFFCVSKRAVENLANEGITANVHLVGDAMHDSVIANLAEARKRDVLARLGLTPKNYVLATVHRVDNTTDPARLAGIIEGLGRAGMPVVLPLHPRTDAALASFSIGTAPNVKITPPFSYLDMLAAEDSARVIATDSGGVQREAYYLGVPCITVREETEWTETVDAGWNRLAGADPSRIADAIASAASKLPAQRLPLYGAGDASERIAKIVSSSVSTVSRG
jgi:UDP-N-acetylglucosamine 2-epimerase